MSTDAIDRLVELVRPPRSPLAASGDWTELEARLGTSLPQDFKTIIGLCGTGLFQDWLLLTSPFATSELFNLNDWIELVRWNFRAYRVEGIGSWKRQNYPVHPEPEGLLFCMASENGDYFSWLTEGPPDQWHIIAWDMSDLRLKPTQYRSISKFFVDVLEKRVGDLPDCDPNDYHTFDPPLYFRPVDADGPIDMRSPLPSE